MYYEGACFIWCEGLNSLNFEDYVANKSREGTELGISNSDTQRLVRKYGTNVDEVFQYVKTVHNCELDIPPSVYAELLYAIYYEMVMTPCDFLIRRTGYLYFNIALVEQYKEAILEIMSNILRYSESETVFYRAQLEQFIDEAKIR